MSDNRAEILQRLQPMFDKARAEGLWFRSMYQSLWFSPDKLAEMHKEGLFIWGPQNWELISPTVRLKYLEREVEKAKQRLAKFKKAMREEVNPND